MPIPILIWAGAALVTGIIGVIAVVNWVEGDDKPNVIKTRRIVIFGPKASGKTTLWYYLQGKPLPQEHKVTDLRQLPNFYIRTEKGEIQVSGGLDIGGDLVYLKTKARELIKKDTFVYFLLDASKLSHKEYMKDVKNRLILITEIQREVGLKPGEGGGITIVATHTDKSILSIAEMRDILGKLTSNKVPFILGDNGDANNVYEQVRQSIIES